MLNDRRFTRKFILMCTLLVTVSSAISITNTVAHSPSTLTLAYNFTTDTLSVSIVHTVSNLQDHFINKIEIWINEILNTTELYTNQPSNSFTYNYQISANIDDEIKVKASCNQGGSLTNTLIVSTNTNPIDTADINIIWILVTITSFLGILSVYRYKRNSGKGQ
ncbi:MAG: hypothetical protein JXA54_12480 [Candidatus Heimdallarchaeota archaeon]|nr:hypothetical protein [Candidatus Heimdallarchaeota archaeon]